MGSGRLIYVFTAAPCKRSRTAYTDPKVFQDIADGQGWRGGLKEDGGAGHSLGMVASLL